MACSLVTEPVLCRKGVLRNFAKIHRKTLVPESLFSLLHNTSDVYFYHSHKKRELPVSYEYASTVNSWMNEWMILFKNIKLTFLPMINY